MRPVRFQPCVGFCVLHSERAHVPRLQNETSTAATTVTVHHHFATFGEEGIDCVDSFFGHVTQVRVVALAPLVDDVELATVGVMAQCIFHATQRDDAHVRISQRCTQIVGGIDAVVVNLGGRNDMLIVCRGLNALANKTTCNVLHVVQAVAKQTFSVRLVHRAVHISRPTCRNALHAIHSASKCTGHGCNGVGIVTQVHCCHNGIFETSGGAHGPHSLRKAHHCPAVAHLCLVGCPCVGQVCVECFCVFIVNLLQCVEYGLIETRTENACANHFGSNSRGPTCNWVEVRNGRLLPCNAHGLFLTPQHSGNADRSNAHHAAVAAGAAVECLVCIFCCCVWVCCVERTTSGVADVGCFIAPCDKVIPHGVLVELAAVSKQCFSKGHCHLGVISEFAWFPVECAAADHFGHAVENGRGETLGVHVGWLEFERCTECIADCCADESTHCSLHLFVGE